MAGYHSREVSEGETHAINLTSQSSLSQEVERESTAGTAAAESETGHAGRTLENESLAVYELEHPGGGGGESNENHDGGERMHSPGLRNPLLSDDGISDQSVGSDIDDNIWSGQCNATCRPKWERLHEKALLDKHRSRWAMVLIRTLNTTLTKRNKTIRELRDQVSALELRITQLLGRQGSRTEVTWPDHLRLYLLGRSDELPVHLRDYKEIYRLSCRESNIAPHPRLVLPDLNLIERELAPQPELQQPVMSAQSMNFEEFTPLIQFRILQHLLCFYGEKIHVLSRLDPYYTPSINDVGGDVERPKLLRRFHVGNAPVSLTDAKLPGVVLAPLQVCRKWHFWGSYLFYGENTFAFSSFGE